MGGVVVGAFAIVVVVAFDFSACLEDISSLVTRLVSCLINNFSSAISCDKELVLLELGEGASIGGAWALSSSRCGVLACGWVGLIVSGCPERGGLDAIRLRRVKEDGGGPVLGS